MHVFYGDNRENTSLLFCLGNSKPLSLRTNLILPYMLGLDIVSFLIACLCCFLSFSFFNIKKIIIVFFFLIAF